MSNTWFQVDRKGLAEIARRRGMAFIITEPIQNAWDEDVKRVDITLTPVPGVPRCDLTVTDDSPDGFRDLADSYMMFRSSYKLADSEKRGRFNIGEKLLLAVAESARITSTTGSVIFDETGRSAGRKRTEAGSVLEARLRMTREEYDGAMKVISSLIPPVGIVTTVNGRELPAREPRATGSFSLMTETQAPEGGFKYVTRKTDVRVYEVRPGEQAHIYEMGIPIDKLDCPWHVEVMQKVPLSIDRSSVYHQYGKDLERAAGEMMAKVMTHEQSREGWVTDALGKIEDDEAVCAIVTKRFGKAVTFDPANPESNKLALDAGYKVVHGPELSKAAWSSVRRAEALKPAGQVFDNGRVRVSANGKPPVPREQWTPAMKALALYAGKFAEHTCERYADVAFYELANSPVLAFCGDGTISFNMSGDGIRKAVEWPYLEGGKRVLDAILIHECAHFKVQDHLTHDFHRECCRIGAAACDFYEVL